MANNQIKCDLDGSGAKCSGNAVKHGRDRAGHVYHACAAHAQYLLGWIRDANQEMDCDSIASRRFESYAYGDD